MELQEEGRGGGRIRLPFVAARLVGLA